MRLFLWPLRFAVLFFAALILCAIAAAVALLVGCLFAVCGLPPKKPIYRQSERKTMHMRLQEPLAN